MGRQNGSDPTALHSSIALLQERFRQLQRVKEMREERELLRVFSHSEAGQVPARLEPFFHPDLILPSRPLHGTSPRQPLHLLQREDHRDMLKLTRLWPEKTTSRVFRSSDMDKVQDVADVDTSLHL